MASETTAYPPLEVTVRAATPGDYSGVLDVSEGIYDGQDYLPLLYHRYLADPWRKCFVCEQGGQVVGFIMSLVVDHGITYTEKAARVHRHHRGQGHYRRMQTHAKRETFRVTPTLTRVVWASTHVDLYQEKIKSDQLPANIITRRERIHFKTTLKFILCLPNDALETGMDPCKVTVCKNNDDIENILLDNTNNKRVFPDQQMVLNWNVYQFLQDNMEYVSKETDVAVCIESDDVTTSLSFGLMENYVSGKKGYVLDFHGTDGNDVIAHLSSHLTFIKTRFDFDENVELSLGIWFPENVDMDPTITFIRDKMKIGNIKSRDLPMTLYEIPFQI